MPIKIPNQLPALSILGDENIFVMSEKRAINQDIRPMEVAILNLMPNKIEAEVQILRMLSNTPLQINIELLRVHANESKHTPKAHLDAFYRDFEDIKHKHYDGLIITGAPLALIAYEEVSYWPKICEIFDWAISHVTSTMFSCWAAHAAMYHFYGINRKLRKNKLSGVYNHKTLQPLEQLTRGFDEEFKVPHSRYGEIDVETYSSVEELDILAQSEDAGAYLVVSKDRRKVFVTGHPEYDACTLADEYNRDISAGLSPTMPEKYFPGDNADAKPSNSWRSHGCLLFSNWLNYYVYQITPYQLESDK